MMYEEVTFFHCKHSARSLDSHSHHFGCLARQLRWPHHPQLRGSQRTPRSELAARSRLLRHAPSPQTQYTRRPAATRERKREARGLAADKTSGALRKRGNENVYIARGLAADKICGSLPQRANENTRRLAAASERGTSGQGKGDTHIHQSKRPATTPSPTRAQHHTRSRSPQERPVLRRAR